MYGLRSFFVSRALWCISFYFTPYPYKKKHFMTREKETTDVCSRCRTEKNTHSRVPFPARSDHGVVRPAELRVVRKRRGHRKRLTRVVPPERFPSRQHANKRDVVKHVHRDCVVRVVCVFVKVRSFWNQAVDLFNQTFAIDWRLAMSNRKFQSFVV